MKISIKTILPIILFSAMLILLSGCFGTVPNDSPGYTPGSIIGRIMVPIDCTECQTSDCIPKSNGEVPSHWTPVEDAIVTVIPHATITDVDGHYTLSDIEPGVYYVITATYGNLVLKDIVEPPGVKAGEIYDAGTANCESTALGLIVEALLDMGLDTEDIELALEIIKENPKFDELVDIICCIIEDCNNVTLVCEIDELIQDLIDDSPGYTPVPESLTILPDSISLCIGATKNIEPYVAFIAHYAEDPDKIVVADCTYSSSDSGIASISGSSVFGVSEGNTIIEVSASYTEGETTVYATGDVLVRVIDCSEDCTPELESLSVVLGNTQPMTLCNGDTQSISSSHIASIIAHYTCGVDETIALSDCNYTSEDPSVASISGRNVTGNTVGSTNIVVKYTDEDKTVVATQKVAVEVVDCTTLESITVSPSPLNLCAEGTGTTATETGTIVTTAHYSDGFSTIVTPSSYVIGNTNIVASVNSAGLVTSGSTVGSTTVTAYYEGKVAAATVNVTDCTVPTTLDYITVSPNPMVLCLTGTGIPDSSTITTTAYYSDGSSAPVTPDSYTPNPLGVVSISGNVVTPAPGALDGDTTTITVSYEEGGITATATVNVTVSDCTNYYTLIVNIVGSGSVTLTPPGGAYPSGTVVGLNPQATPGWTFTGWSGTNGSEVTGNSITMNGDKSVTATFTQDCYTLAVNIVGSGTVGQNPLPGTGDCYLSGTSVTLTPTATPGWTFTGWSGTNGSEVTGNSITMNGDKSVTATFTQDCYTLAVNIVGSGTVGQNPLPGTGDCYLSGTSVTLTPTATPGWTFTGWSGTNGSEVTGNSITMNGDKSVTATFIEDTGTVSGKICQHNGNGYGQAWAYFRNTDTNEIYSTKGAPGSGNYSIILPVGNYVLWANKPSGSQCPTSIGYNTNGGNSDQDPNGWICLTVSSAGMHYYDIWVDNAWGSHPGPCVVPPSNTCQ